jgi:hypothetical protein
MNCDKLIHLFRNISDIVPSFTTMSDVEKFMFLLTSHDFDICKVACAVTFVSVCWTTGLGCTNLT